MSDDGTVRVGIIGRGFGARAVAPAFEATDGCAVVDVVSPRDVEAVDALCGRTDVDLISVHSPPFMHLEHVRKAVEGSHAVLCDKPFGANGREAEQMDALARDAGVLNLVNYEFRVHPVRSELRKLVLDGAIGRVEHVGITAVSAGFPPSRPYRWVFDQARGGGWIRVSGAHYIDFLRWTFGEITEASAVRRTTVGERPDPDGVVHQCTGEDGYTATMRTADGVSFAIDSTATAGADVPSRVLVAGRDGVLEVVYDSVHEVGGRILLHGPTATTEACRIEPWRDPTVHDDSVMTRLTPLIRDAVLAGEPGATLATFADGLASTRVMDALTAVG